VLRDFKDLVARANEDARRTGGIDDEPGTCGLCGKNIGEAERAGRAPRVR
jgi:hypothetical protein